MPNIFKYYTNIFTLMFKLNFAWGAETGWAYEAIKEANSDFISSKEWEALKSKYQTKNPDEFKSALKKLVKEDWLKSNLEVSREIDKIVSDWNEEISETTDETQSNLNETREEVEKSNPFLRTLGYKKPYMRWEDVRALQEYLNANGFNTNGVDGVFGPGTFRALKKFQKKVLHFRKPDGRMDLNGKTMNYIVRDLNNDLNLTEKNTKYWKEANEVVDYLTDIDKYLTAFNKIYGWTEDIISRDNGLLWIVTRLGGSSLDRLEKELKPDYSKIDKKALAKELGISENSKKFKEGLVRTALIAAISAVLSGWTSVALELFAINYGENLRKWPEMSKILKALGKWNVDMKKEMRDVYLSKDTTVPGLNKIVDVLNNPNMDTANLKRFMKEVYQPNWFQDTFGIFLPDWYEKVEELIKKFEKTGTTKDAKAAVTEIYKLAHQAYNEAKKEYAKAKKDYENTPKDILDKARDPAAIINVYGDEDETQAVHDATYIVRRYESSRKELEKARVGLGKLWTVASRYTNLDAKRAQIQWEKFDKKAAIKVEKQLDAELTRLYGSRRLKKVTEKLNSRQSFGYRVDVNKVNDQNYMASLLTKMNKETINGKTSVLAWVMRWIKQHYWINFTVEEFTNAFMQTAEKTDSKYILSNLGRERNQRFQWKINGNLFKIDLNWMPIYFKDSCTNIVTIVNDLVTTVDSTSSIPVVISVKTWYKRGGWKWDSSTPGEERGDSTTPGETQWGSNWGGGGTPWIEEPWVRPEDIPGSVETPTVEVWGGRT